MKPEAEVTNSCTADTDGREAIQRKERLCRFSSAFNRLKKCYIQCLNVFIFCNTVQVYKMTLIALRCKQVSSSHSVAAQGLLAASKIM